MSSSENAEAGTDARRPIDPRWIAYGAVLSVGLAVAVVLVKHGAGAIALGLALVATLVPLTLIDLDRRLIPNKITGPSVLVAIAIGLISHPSGVPTQLLWGAVGAGVMLVFALLYRGGLGMGDVKLAGVLGVYLDNSVVVALVIGILAGGVVAVGVLLRVGVKQGRRAKMPYGPMLALGGVVGLLDGPSIVHWYLHSMHH
jgi:leader peptidase (prepilin peptidase)/N-methyltransferase